MPQNYLRVEDFLEEHNAVCNKNIFKNRKTRTFFSPFLVCRQTDRQKVLIPFYNLHCIWELTFPVLDTCKIHNKQGDCNYVSHSSNWLHFGKFVKLCCKLLTEIARQWKLQDIEKQSVITLKKSCQEKHLRLSICTLYFSHKPHLLLFSVLVPFKVQNNVAVIQSARTFGFRYRMLLLLFSVLVLSVSGTE
jgi:hypothetical protein